MEDREEGQVEGVRGEREDEEEEEEEKSEGARWGWKWLGRALVMSLRLL